MADLPPILDNEAQQQPFASEPEVRAPAPRMGLPCPKCGKPIEVQLGSPKCDIHSTVYVIVVEYKGEVECGFCGLRVMPVLQSISGVQIALVPTQLQSSRVQLAQSSSMTHLPKAPVLGNGSYLSYFSRFGKTV